MSDAPEHRSFPDTANGLPQKPGEAELWAAGCDLETARFVAGQLERQGFRIVRADLHREEALKHLAQSGQIMDRIEALEAQMAEAKVALEFYGDGCDAPPNGDCGYTDDNLCCRTARAALAKLENDK